MDFIWHYWLEIFFGLIITYVGYLYRKVNQYVKQIDRNEEVLKELLKNTIMDKYTKYEREGTMSLEEKKALFDLYHKCENMGCDGLIKDLMDKIKNIPEQDS
ncbi:MAG: hypothetical protein PHN72_04835 [Bacilli bacterium]|nr:hypothetical protein [Bacilli bacterium]